MPISAESLKSRRTAAPGRSIEATDKAAARTVTSRVIIAGHIAPARVIKTSISCEYREFRKRGGRHDADRNPSLIYRYSKRARARGVQADREQYYGEGLFASRNLQPSSSVRDLTGPDEASGNFFRDGEIACGTTVSSGVSRDSGSARIRDSRTMEWSPSRWSTSTLQRIERPSLRPFKSEVPGKPTSSPQCLIPFWKRNTSDRKRGANRCAILNGDRTNPELKTATTRSAQRSTCFRPKPGFGRSLESRDVLPRSLSQP